MTNLACELTVDQLDIVSGGGHANGLGDDLAMVSIQSLMSQRQAAMQAAADLLQTMNDTTKTVLHNIGN
jgi:hypothetical protein